MVRHSLCLGFFATLLFWVGGCGHPVGREVQRITSPDDLVDAVLVEMQTTALSPFWFKAYIVPKGRDWEKEEPIMEIDRFSGLWIAWRGSCFLEIHYKQGEVWSFRNNWESREVHGLKYRVESRLFPESPWTIKMIEEGEYLKNIAKKSTIRPQIVFPGFKKLEDAAD